MNEQIKRYIDTATAQMRWKKARETVSDELQGHIEEQAEAFIVQTGTDAETATQDAIREMGDPVEVGTLLDRSYRPKPVWQGMLILLLLLGLGNIPNYINYGQVLIYMGLSAACFLVPYLLDFTIYARFPRIICVILIWLILAGSLLGLNLLVINTEGLHMLLIVAGVAFMFSMRGGGVKTLLLCGILFTAIPCIFAWFLNTTDLQYALAGGVAALIIAIIGGCFNIPRKKALLIVLVPTVVAVVLLAVYYFHLYQDAVWIAQLYSDPNAEIYTGPTDFMVVQQTLSRAAPIGSGGDLWINLPSRNYLFTFMIYSIGWLPFIGVLAGIVIAFACLYKHCLRQRSMLGRMVSTCIITLYAISTGLYTALNLGLPVAYMWVALPFVDITMISLADVILLGVLLSVFRTGDIVRDEKVRAVA